MVEMGSDPCAPTGLNINAGSQLRCNGSMFINLFIKYANTREIYNL